MNFLNNYTLDAETIKLNAYRLLCLFYTNKEIARQADPDSRTDFLSLLEQQFFASELTKLLLSIAISLRIFDDQMDGLPSGSPRKEAYLQIRSVVNKNCHCMMFEQLTLREVCNKIMHATTVEPHEREASDSHKIDEDNLLGWSEAADQSLGETGPKPNPVKWQHLTCIVRLAGTRQGEGWAYLLDVPVFVEAICKLLTAQANGPMGG